MEDGDDNVMLLRGHLDLTRTGESHAVEVCVGCKVGGGRVVTLSHRSDAHMSLTVTTSLLLTLQAFPECLLSARYQARIGSPGCNGEQVG